MSAIVIDGGIIHYESWGRGGPLILLHGWLGSWRYWMPTMEELAEQHRTYALDLWGFGDSDKSTNRHGVEKYVDLLKAFMDELGVAPAALVGHSLGATVAVKFAVANPNRVTKLMLVSLPVVGEAINRRLFTAGSTSRLGRLLGGRWPVDHEEVLAEAEKANENVIALTVQACAELDLRENLRQIKVPLLAVYGEKDNLVDPTQAKLLENTASNVRSITLPESRHFPMLDEASKFHRLLRDFLVTDDLESLTLKEEWRRRTH
ncbi:MAG: alpha/beta fold hydrolase [Anaerolineales bacterium]|nr:MAG: alpha/beta fold hydrolase [Anaerolineales bacterium]